MDHLEMKHSVSCSLQDRDTSTGVILGAHFRTLECARYVIIVDLFDLYHPDVFLEAVHL
jgi:hypothetical protein